jgi:hypothetical protein
MNFKRQATKQKNMVLGRTVTPCEEIPYYPPGVQIPKEEIRKYGLDCQSALDRDPVLDADHPENGVLIPCRNTVLMPLRRASSGLVAIS